MFKRVIRKPGLHDIQRQPDGQLTIGRFRNLPDMSVNESLCPSAAFLGPYADNKTALSTLVGDALSSIGDFRTKTWEGPKIHHDPQHNQSLADLKERFGTLLKYLKDNSTPFSSLRYIAHMTGDQLLPALAAYYAGMIYNSNNVTIQASTATTLLEILAMRDLCDMVGFTRQAVHFREKNGCADHMADPWAHITVDGSVANIEAMWSAREAKLLPFATVNALEREPSFEKAIGLEVTTCAGNAIRLLGAESWVLWNLTRDERLAIPYKIAQMTGLEDYVVWSILAKYDLNALGWQAFTPYFYNNHWPITLIPSTAHYSWPKAAALLGIGTANSQTVMVDQFGRMNINNLRIKLENAKANKQPILMAVSVFGSTEESAVDPLSDILNIRDEYRKQGLEFDVHVDAAWGGYFISTIRKEFKIEEIKNTPKAISDLSSYEPFLDDTSQVLLSDYVIEQTKDIRFVDSITIDPHKMGYIQYPAGSIIYNNGDVINLTTFTGSYIGSAADPTVGMFGVEGSRPGAAAAAVYFTHACLRPDYKGYGEVITRSLYNTRQFYAELMFMGHEDKFKTALLMPYDESYQPFVKENILRKDMDEIRRDPAALEVFRALGPDQNIVDYGFNPMVDGKVNTSVTAYNEFTQKVYDKLRLQYSKQGIPLPEKPELMLSMTTFNEADYGKDFVEGFAARLGLDVSAGVPNGLNCLRSTIMSPFTSAIQVDGKKGSYWPEIMEMLGNAVAKLAS
ncbi:MAG: pyridoxal phosphate-dependent decarboxylase family protein [Candidatus Electronema sp. V4]|uniref:pyridoxal phosphate-dependent decarboxylase family protein n=1 Tax=Candidatus Electronema sp. V4 TaxID=3454756 RepID=UPI0040557BDC